MCTNFENNRLITDNLRRKNAKMLCFLRCHVAQKHDVVRQKRRLAIRSAIRKSGDLDLDLYPILTKFVKYYAITCPEMLWKI